MRYEFESEPESEFESSPSRVRVVSESKVQYRFSPVVLSLGNSGVPE